MISFKECGIIIATFSFPIIYKIAYIHKLVYILRALNQIYLHMKLTWAFNLWISNFILKWSFQCEHVNFGNGWESCSVYVRNGD